MACRSTARVTTGQRVSLNTIEEAGQETRDGHPYWTYEHTSQVLLRNFEMHLSATLCAMLLSNHSNIIQSSVQMC